MTENEDYYVVKYSFENHFSVIDSIFLIKLISYKCLSVYDALHVIRYHCIEGATSEGIVDQEVIFDGGKAYINSYNSIDKYSYELMKKHIVSFNIKHNISITFD